MSSASPTNEKGSDTQESKGSWANSPTCCGILSFFDNYVEDATAKEQDATAKEQQQPRPIITKERTSKIFSRPNKIRYKSIHGNSVAELAVETSDEEDSDDEEGSKDNRNCLYVETDQKVNSAIFSAAAIDKELRTRDGILVYDGMARDDQDLEEEEEDQVEHAVMERNLVEKARCLERKQSSVRKLEFIEAPKVDARSSMLLQKYRDESSNRYATWGPT
eukprot:15340148-Ditylum_brightwellii.AAC.1